MGRDFRYDLLFEPMALRPATAKNRHSVNAEVGWGVVCPEQVELQVRSTCLSLKPLSPS